MIGYLNGRLLQKHPPFVLLDVNGVGYELEAPMSTIYELPAENQPASLYIHMVVREDSQLLYGFSDQQQRDLFRMLLRVNGVGPRVGLAILSTLSSGEFASCVVNGDVAALTRVPGIGSKTASRMILDMKDRIDDRFLVQGGTGAAGIGEAEQLIQDAVGALVALGYRAKDAGAAVEAVRGQGMDRDELIRNALQRLSGYRS